MSCAPNNRRRAFTLLEVTIAVMIFSLIAIAIYRLVETSIQSIKISTDDSVYKGSVAGLVAVLQEEFSNLAPNQNGALLGEAHQFNGKASDQIEWLTQAGNGMFTEAATGQWKLTLLLRPQENTYTLGLLRELPDNSSKDENWLPLLQNVDAVEIRYFDPRLNAWLEKWSDATARPALVRIRIWRTDETIPYEAVIELPPTKLPS